MALKIVDNFIGESRKSDKNLLSDSFTLNMYLEKQGVDSPTSLVLRSINGFDKIADIQGFPRGSFVASKGEDKNPRLFTVYNSILYCVDYVNGEWVSTRVGEILNGTNRVSMCETYGEGANHPYLCIADGVSVHCVPTDIPKEELQKQYRTIKLPIGADGEEIQPSYVTYEFGYLTINDTNSDNFYRSHQFPFELSEDLVDVNYDVFTYDPIDKTKSDIGFAIPADWVPDIITAMCSTNARLYTFGPKSIQYFNATNNAQQPFNSPDTSAINIGIQAPSSLSTLGDMVFFLGSSAQGQNGIFIIQGASNPQRISNSDLEREISTFKNASDAIGFSWQENSHTFYAITFQEDAKTFVYDVEMGAWHNRCSTNYKTNTDYQWRYVNPVLHRGKLIYQTNDALVVDSFGKYTEHDGNTIKRLRRGGCTINNYTPFMVDNIQFNLTNGYVDYSKPQVNPKVMFRFSTNGTLLNNERLGFAGRAGNYGYTTQFPRLGVGSFFYFELSCTEDCDFVIMPPIITGTPIKRGF